MGSQSSQPYGAASQAQSPFMQNMGAPQFGMTRPQYPQQGYQQQPYPVQQPQYQLDTKPLATTNLMQQSPQTSNPYQAGNNQPVNLQQANGMQQQVIKPMGEPGSFGYIGQIKPMGQLGSIGGQMDLSQDAYRRHLATALYRSQADIPTYDQWVQQRQTPYQAGNNIIPTILQQQSNPPMSLKSFMGGLIGTPYKSSQMKQFNFKKQKFMR